MKTAVVNVLNGEASVDPLLVKFTNGDVNKECNDQLKLTLYKSSDTQDERKKHRKILVAESSKMKYSGSNFGMAAKSNTMCKYLVGVFNKKSSTLDVYNSTMVTLQPKIYTDEKDEPEMQSNISYMEKNNLLVEAFGSKKKKKAMMSRIRNKIDSDDLEKSVSKVFNHIKNVEEHEEAKPSLQTIEYDILPQFNKDAKSPAMIYPLSSLLSSEDLDALKLPVMEILTNLKSEKEIWRKENKFPEYVFSHFDVLPFNEEERILKTSFLLYFSYLLRCYHLNYKSLRVKDPLPDLPTRIKNKIFSLFSLQQKNVRCIPKRLKDKLVCYIVVMSLIIDGNTIDCLLIRKDLKMSLQKFINFAKFVGCTIESNTRSRKRKAGEDNPAEYKRAILKVPLPKNFPHHMPLATGRKK